MPKNALFLLKNRKNRRALRARTQTPLDEILATRLAALLMIRSIVVLLAIKNVM